MTNSFQAVFVMPFLHAFLPEGGKENMQKKWLCYYLKYP
jgi:hypothetical protein